MCGHLTPSHWLQWLCHHLCVLAGSSSRRLLTVGIVLTFFCILARTILESTFSSVLTAVGCHAGYLGVRFGCVSTGCFAVEAFFLCKCMVTSRKGGALEMQGGCHSAD